MIGNNSCGTPSIMAGVTADNIEALDVALYDGTRLMHSLALSLPLFVIAAAGLAGTEPPLAAARLDIIPARLWGRAEGVRTALRTLSTAAAPLVFGFLAEPLGANSSSIAAARSGVGSGGAGSARGLEYTLTIMLTVLVAAGWVLLLVARRSYGRDVATPSHPMKPTSLPRRLVLWGSSFVRHRTGIRTVPGPRGMVKQGTTQEREWLGSSNDSGSTVTGTGAAGR